MPREKHRLPPGVLAGTYSRHPLIKLVLFGVVNIITKRNLLAFELWS